MFAVEEQIDIENFQRQTVIARKARPASKISCSRTPQFGPAGFILGVAGQQFAETPCAEECEPAEWYAGPSTVPISTPRAGPHDDGLPARQRSGSGAMNTPRMPLLPWLTRN